MLGILAILAAAGAAVGTVVTLTSPGRKLEEADKLVKDGKFEDAETVYLSIWSKHKAAPAHLAETYLKQAKKSNGTEFIKKALALPETNLSAEAATGLLDAKKAVIKYADEQATKAFDKGKLTDAVAFSEVIASVGPSYKTKALRYRIYEKTLGLLSGRVSEDSLKLEISGGSKKAVDYTLEVAEKLHEAKRYNDAARIISFIVNDNRAKQLNEKNTLACIKETGGLVCVSGRIDPEQITFAETYADAINETRRWEERLRIYSAIQTARASQRVAKKIEIVYQDAASHYFTNGDFSNAYEISSRARGLSPALSHIFLDSTLALAKAGTLKKADGLLEEINKQADPLAELVKFIDYFPSELRGTFITKTAEQILGVFSTKEIEATKQFNQQRDFDIKADLLAIILKQSTSAFRVLISQAIASPVLFPDKESASCKRWIQIIGSFEDKAFTTGCLKTLVLKAYPAEQTYVDAVIQLIDSTPEVENQLAILNNALSVSRSSRLIQRKEQIAESLALDDPKKTLALCDELEGLTATGILRQKAYLRLAVVTKDLDKKLEYLRKSLKTSGSSKPAESQIYREAMNLAEGYISTGKGQEGYAVYDEFPCRESVRGFLVHKLEDARKETGDAAACTHLEKTLAKFETLPFKEEFNTSSEIKSLWAELVSRSLLKAGKQSAEKAINTLTSLKQRVMDSFFSYSRDLLDPIDRKLHDLNFGLGNEKEEDGDFKKAMELYELANSFHDDMNAIGRAAICATKREDLSIAEIQSAVNRVRETVRADIWKDLLYRYVLILLKNGHINDATRISDRLRNAKLIALCESYRIKQCKSDILAINADLESLNSGKLSLTQAQELNVHIDSCLSRIIEIYPEYIGRKEQYINAVNNAVIAAAFKEGKYAVAFDLLLKKSPDLLSNDRTFRNLAVAALGIMEDSGLTDDNYKQVISVWLSAVYCDKLIVQSLDFTSWDDPYTFTLKDALSETWDYSDMPENINMDDTSDTNIGIGAVQRSLLDRSDAVLTGGNPAYYDFYRKEVDAMNAMAAYHLDKSISEDVICPYLFTVLPKEYRANLESKLDDSESALRVGYLYGLTSGKYEEYHKACSYFTACEEALGSLTRVKSSFTSARIIVIKRFPDLFGKLVQKSENSFDSMVNAGKTYRVLCQPFGIICRALANKDFSYKYSLFINSEVIPKLNNDEMEESEGLKYLYTAYQVCRQNEQLNNNISKVLCSVVNEYIINGTNDSWDSLSIVLEDSGNSSLCDAVLKNLKEAAGVIAITGKEAGALRVVDLIEKYYPSKLSSTSSTRNAISKGKLQGQLSSIIAKANNNQIDSKEALKQIYDIYIQDKDDERICENLAIVAANCIMEYIWEESYAAYSVKLLLDKLYLNRSETFKSHTKPFDERFNKIAIHISGDIVDLMGGRKSLKSGAKEGLRYLKKFKSPNVKLDRIIDMVL